ncbi:MAG: hypothetical protein E6G05_13845 [Actinobacteria bacterium]|nr:MAG: hypothetical protein E6G05_13845 [Actinomycetota bacterium]
MTDAIERELAASPPSRLGRLTHEQQDDLAQSIRDAKRRQAAALAAAGEQALELIPRLLRRPVRRLFR